MEKFPRSKSSRENENPRGMHDLRSYSSSGYNSNQSRDYVSDNFKGMMIKNKNLGNNNNNNNSKNKSKMGTCSSRKNWKLSMEPELQRKKRVAGYKAYGVEGKMKASLRKSFSWVKDIVHGFW